MYNLIQKTSLPHPLIFLVSILILGGGLRLTCVTMLELEQFADYKNYYIMASHLYDKKGLVDENGNLAFMSSGYPLFMYGIFLITGKSVAAIQYVNALVSVLSIYLIYLVGMELFRKHFPALLAASFWSVYAPAIVYTEYLAKENLMIPLLLGQVLTVLRYPSSTRRGLWAAILGVLSGMQALVGLAGLAMFPVIVVSIWLAQGRLKEKITHLSIVMMCALIIVAPWLYRNYMLFGKPILNSNGGFNFYLGNNPAANGMFVNISETPLGDSWKDLKKQLNEVERSTYCKKMAWEYIKDNPTHSFQLALKKGGLFWWPPLHDGEGGNQSPMEKAARIIWLIQYMALFLLALPTLFYEKIYLKKLWMLYGGILCYVGIHMIFHVSSFRYRLTIMPIICLLAGHTIWHFFMRFQPSQGAWGK